MICLKYQYGLVSGEYLSILMFQNKPKRICSLTKATNLLILMSFSIIPVKRCSIQKHLGIHLREKLNFNHHVKEKITKANKGIGVIKKLSNTLPRDALLTIYKSFVRPHLEYL